ncbi:MAG: carbon-nitrogen hydrolase family protein [Rhodovibrionaceae bacterium]|nr:carbon-nitrogen hydrolase family protein [Rhodovibrionaceae bacterium]
MNPFSIAGVQMEVSAGGNNIPEMRRQLKVLMQRFPWVQMVVFSELCAHGPLPAHAQPVGGPAEAEFQAMAAEHHIWLVPGSIFEIENGHIYNMAMVIDPAGGIVGRYRKMFPFEPYEEGVSPGHQFLVFDIPEVGRMGLSICYDMWFPETTRTMAAMGAEVIIHPSLTNTIDRGIELAITRASAAINQCFVVDVNGVGDGGYGRSTVVGPQGNVIYEAGSGAEIIPVQLHLDQVRWERQNGILGLGQVLKSFRDRRVDFPVYLPERFDNTYLNSLGALRKASRHGAEESTLAPQAPAEGLPPISGHLKH